MDEQERGGQGFHGWPQVVLAVLADFFITRSSGPNRGEPILDLCSGLDPLGIQRARKVRQVMALILGAVVCWLLGTVAREVFRGRVELIAPLSVLTMLAVGFGLLYLALFRKKKKKRYLPPKEQAYQEKWHYVSPYEHIVSFREITQSPGYALLILVITVVAVTGVCAAFVLAMTGWKALTDDICYLSFPYRATATVVQTRQEGRFPQYTLELQEEVAGCRSFDARDHRYICRENRVGKPYLVLFSEPSKGYFVPVDFFLVSNAVLAAEVVLVGLLAFWGRWLWPPLLYGWQKLEDRLMHWMCGCS